MKYSDPITGELKNIYVKASDTLPIGTVVEYDGDIVPDGYEEIEDVLFEGSSTGDLTLKDSASNYSRFKVYGTGLDGVNTYTEILEPNGKNASMKAFVLNEDGMYVSNLMFSISDNVITKAQNFNAVCQATTYNRYAENKNTITTIIGVK